MSDPSFPLNYVAKAAYCSYPGCNVPYRGSACDEHREWATQYYKSDCWKSKQAEIFERSSGLCEYCLRRRAETVHHRTYHGFGGHEDLRNLMACCHPCHNFIHYGFIAPWRSPPHRCSPFAMSDGGFTGDQLSPGHWMHRDLYINGWSRSSARQLGIIEELLTLLGILVRIITWEEIVREAISTDSESPPKRPPQKRVKTPKRKCNKCGMSMRKGDFRVEQCEKCAMVAERQALDSIVAGRNPCLCIDCSCQIPSGKIRCQWCKGALTIYCFLHADYTSSPSSFCCHCHKDVPFGALMCLQCHRSGKSIPMKP